MQAGARDACELNSIWEKPLKYLGETGLSPRLGDFVVDTWGARVRAQSHEGAVWCVSAIERQSLCQLCDHTGSVSCATVDALLSVK